MSEGIMPAPVQEAPASPVPVEGNVLVAAKPEVTPQQPEAKKGVSFLHRIKSLFARHVAGGDQLKPPVEAPASSQAASESVQPASVTPEAPVPPATPEKTV